MKYLNAEQLSGFENYKICPRFIAPNVLTFTGALLTMFNFVILSFYDPYYYASSEEPPGNIYPPVPKWIWFVCAINHFVAHTLDGIDGKQARRTGTSGPLGELFDHGLDAWTSLFIPTCVYSMFGRLDYSINPFHFYFVLWNILSTFYISHFEKYLTTVLFLPWGYDISQLVILVVYILTGIFDHSLWKFHLFGLPAGIYFEILMYAGSLACAVPMSVYNIYKSYKDETGKMLSFCEAMRPLVNLIIFFTLSTLWAVCSPNDILDLNPRVFMYAVGTIFANINCRLIVSQMSNTRSELINWLMYPFVIAIVVSFTLPSFEQGLLIFTSVLATLAHCHYGICVVREMCAHFNIRCFHIKDRTD